MSVWNQLVSVYPSGIIVVSSVVVDKLIVRSECELSRHLTGVDLEAQVHQLVSRNQDTLPLIDRNPQGLYEVYSPTKGLGIMIKEEPVIEISNTFWLPAKLPQGTPWQISGREKVTGLDPSRVVSKNVSGHSIICRYDFETAVEAVTGENQSK